MQQGSGVDTPPSQVRKDASKPPRLQGSKGEAYTTPKQLPQLAVRGSSDSTKKGLASAIASANKFIASSQGKYKGQFLDLPASTLCDQIYYLV